MGRSDEVRFVFEIEVTDAHAFRAAVEECCAISSEEPGTLTYDWYFNPESGAARLYESYASVDAVLAHTAGRVFTEIGPRLLQSCRFISGDCFGEAHRLAESTQLLPVTYYGLPFSGLNPRDSATYIEG